MIKKQTNRQRNRENMFLPHVILNPNPPKLLQVDDDTVFDLHALARVNKPMWGPVVDLNNSQSYYINMCRSKPRITSRLKLERFPGPSCEFERLPERYASISSCDLIHFGWGEGWRG